MMNVGYVPALDNFLEMTEYKEKLEKEKSRVQTQMNHPLLKKLDLEIEKIQSKQVRFFIILMDENLILNSVKLLDMLMFLIPKWLDFSY